MDTVYKLTNQDMTTHAGCQWVVGELVETNGVGELCGPGWLHCYSDPLVALMHNPIHADIDKPRLWRCEAEGSMKDDRGLKRGYTRLRLVEEMPTEAVTIRQRVLYAILCTRAVLSRGTIPVWDAWADAYMAGDVTEAAAWAAAARAARAAEAAAAEAEAAAEAAAWAEAAEAWAEAAEAWAARAAAEAAAAAWAAAARAARAAAEAAAARAAAEAWAARAAAEAAAWAARAAVEAVGAANLDFPALARQAMEEG